MTTGNEATFQPPRPFSIHVPDQDLDRLQRLVEVVDMKPYLANLLGDAGQLPTDDFTYGLAPNKSMALVERLKHGFDWRTWESKMNAMGQHGIVKIENVPGLAPMDIHFVHSRSTSADALPLILIHGWPGTFFEFHEIVPLLTPKFHVVCPSLPGYTFSSPPRSMNASGPISFTQVAHLMDALMRSLGYEKYVGQGGDWGSMVLRALAEIFPHRCRAIRKEIFFSNLRQSF